jgi:hypothetical protein
MASHLRRAQRMSNMLDVLDLLTAQHIPGETGAAAALPPA